MRRLVYGEAMGLLAFHLFLYGVLYRLAAARAAGPWTAMLSGQAVTLLAAAAIVFLLNRGGIHRRGLPARPKEDLPRRVGAACTTLFLLGAMAVGVRILAPEFDDVAFARHGLGNPAAFQRFLSSLVFAVATEEIVFRACQDRLRFSLGKPASLAAVAAAFALYHLAPGQALDRQALVTIAATATGGLALAWLYERTAGLGILILVHLSYDLLALTQARFHVERRGLAELALWAAWLLGSAALAAWLRRPEKESPRRVRGSPGWVVAGAIVFGIVLPLVVRKIQTLL